MIRSRPPALPLATLLALAALASCRDASLPTAAVSPGRPRLATAASACQVTNPDDGEPGSLRAAVQDPACAVVTFADAFSGGTVELMNGQLEVNRSLEIAGPTAGVTIRRRGETAHDRLLEVGAQGDVRLARLTLTGGVANPQSARAQSEGARS
jgi:hypothetical protein